MSPVPKVNKHPSNGKFKLKEDKEQLQICHFSISKNNHNKLSVKGQQPR